MDKPIEIKRPKAAYIVQMGQVLFGFSYYGVYILILSYFSRALHYNEVAAVALMGSYGAIGPILNFVGGFVSDRFLGARRSYFIGYIIYVVGFAVLGISTTYIESHIETAILLAIIGISVVSVARGIANVSDEVILTKSHQSQGLENTIDISYSYNYMFKNTGSVTGKILFGMMLGTSIGLIMAYRIDFYIAAIMMSFAVLIQFVYKKHLRAGCNDVDLQPLNLKKGIGIISYIIALLVFCFFAFKMDSSIISIVVYVMFIFAIGYYILEMLKTQDATRMKMFIALILFFELLAFNVYYNQMFTSLVLYPMHIMQEPTIAGVTIKAEMAMVFNPLWCVLGSPIVIGLVTFLLKRGIKLHVGYKFAIGLFMSAGSYFLFWLSSYIAIRTQAESISMWWMFIGHSLVAMAELFVLNLGVAAISTLVPKHMTGTVLGIKIMTMSVGSIIGAQVARMITLKPNTTYSSLEVFTTYKPFFANLSIMASIIGVIFIFTALWMQKLERKYV